LALWEAELVLSVLNPARVRFFAKALGKAKTDPLDKQVIGTLSRNRISRLVGRPPSMMIAACKKKKRFIQGGRKVPRSACTWLARRRLRPARGIREFDRAGCGTAGFSRLAYGGTEDLMRGRMPWGDQHAAFPFPLGRACEENSF